MNNDNNKQLELNGENADALVTTKFYDRELNTPLHYAIRANNIEKVNEELLKNYDINFANDFGWTPLMIAARFGFLNIVKILIEAGGDATKCNRYEMSVFDMAVSSGNLEVVHLILQHLLTGGVSRASLESIISPFSISVIFNHKHIVNYLLEKSFDINIGSIDTGITPAIFAATLGNSDMLQFLLVNGADINAKCVQGDSANEILNRTNAMSPAIFPQFFQGRYVQQNSPQFTFFSYTPNKNIIRNSSCVHTPNYIFSPEISPMPMTYGREAFFQSNFPPNLIVPHSPMMYTNVTATMADDDINEEVFEADTHNGIINGTFNTVTSLNKTYIHPFSPIISATDYSNQIQQ